MKLKNLLITIPFLLFGLSNVYSQELPDTVNIGTAPNAGNGDNLRNAFNKVNNNDQYLYEEKLKHDDTLTAHNTRLIAVESAGASGVITDLTSTAWRFYYGDGSGNVTELALGSSGQYLQSTGASSVPTWGLPAGSGDMVSTNNLSDVASASASLVNLGLTATATEINYTTNVTSDIQAQLNAKADTANADDPGTLLWLLSDTIILGSFSAVDTFNTSFIYGSFYNGGSDTLVVTEMRAVLQGTTPSITVDVEWHATLNSGSATGLNTTPPTITSTTTGDSDTAFDNSQIPPGVWVWLKTPTVTTEPTYMSVTLCGYRLNRAY